MTEADIRNNLSRNIKIFRSIQKISQAELAEKAEISIPFLSQIECGNKFPSPAILAKLADALKISVADLFAEKDAVKKEDYKFMIDAMKAVLQGQVKSFEDFCTAYFQ
ncbi:MAG: helix-turn-helix transcriptional regulator [Spirochaetaceae bacterium]|nr:helix-turn-helix transcriptional regulator [Spirochaetaceae bacterium]